MHDSYIACGIHSMGSMNREPNRDNYSKLSRAAAADQKKTTVVRLTTWNNTKYIYSSTLAMALYLLLKIHRVYRE